MEAPQRSKWLRLAQKDADHFTLSSLVVYAYDARFVYVFVAPLQNMVFLTDLPKRLPPKEFYDRYSRWCHYIDKNETTNRGYLFGYGFNFLVDEKIYIDVTFGMDTESKCSITRLPTGARNNDLDNITRTVFKMLPVDEYPALMCELAKGSLYETILNELSQGS